MAKKQAKASEKPIREQRFEMRLTAEEKAAFQEAADRQGIGLAQGLRLAGKMVVRRRNGNVEL